MHQIDFSDTNLLIKYNQSTHLCQVKVILANRVDQGQTRRVFGDTPQPLYNTIVGVQANFCVSYPNRVILRVKCIGYIGKLNNHLGSNPDLCYIRNCVITNHVIKRFTCN